MKVNVAIAGGGPAGLAVAIQAAARGLSTVVLERRATPLDKACGEGLMPAGVRELDGLGVRQLIPPSDCTPLVGIRYIQEDGTRLEGRLPGKGGLGIRRLALVSALASRARALGAEVRSECGVVRHYRSSSGMVIETTRDCIEADILVAADGLASPLRRAEGLERAGHGPRRFGLRQHFAFAPWSQWVEVYLSPWAEAYVTPAGDHRVGVAFLWEDGRLGGRISVCSLLSRFPLLADRLGDAATDSVPRGAGPLARSAQSWIKDRFVLVGDAAGYVDAITGEGLSLSFAAAASLGKILPIALARGATRASLAPYQWEFGRRYRKYARVTRAVLALSRHPRLRQLLLRRLAARRRIFEKLLEWWAPALDALNERELPAGMSRVAASRSSEDVI